MMRKQLMSLAAAGALVALTSAAWAKDKISDFDMVGLRTGMTLEEAKERLLAYEPTLMLEQRDMYFVYSDGLTAHKTETFPHLLEARRRDGMESLTLEFSPPPAGKKVIRIARYQKPSSNPPTVARYLAALVKKYGPAYSQPSGVAVVWQVPQNGVDCATHGGAIPGLLSQDRDYLNMRLNQIAMENDPSRCKSPINFNLGTYTKPGDQPIGEVRASIVDIPAAITAQRAASKWVAELAAAATKKRIENSGEVPEL